MPESKASESKISEPKVAVIVFPGTNPEAETVAACRDAGMDAELFWWSEDSEKLRSFDAYVIAGGFAHEDRVRAGAIAAKSPIVAVIKEEAEKGKLVLGLCNGAQVLAEAGMLGPVALAHNLPSHHFQGLLVDVEVDREPERCAFTAGLAPGMSLRMALAHGEGRFTGESAVFDDLEEHGRIILRFSDESPNGAMRRAAGICNAASGARGMDIQRRVRQTRAARWRSKYADRRPRHLRLHGPGPALDAVA